MLEIIGFIVWIWLASCLTVTPFVIGCLVGFKGGFGRINAFISSVSICLAAISWYFIFTSLSVIIN